ncbi:MAG: tetratricopeptide repeat protein [Vicinamibacterales bacterium]
MTGDIAAAKQATTQVLRSRFLGDAERATAELLLARVAAAEGSPEEETKRLERALVLAERVDDPAQIAWIQLRILSLTADRMGPSASHPLMGKVRHNVSCAGEPPLSIALHLFVADADGKHGLLGKSQRHVRLAQSLLEKYPNFWLSGWAEITSLALALMKSDLPSALVHGHAALALGQQCGVAVVRRSSLGNMGRAKFMEGNYDGALEVLNEALALCTPNSDSHAGIRDSIARVYMAIGRPEDSVPFLDHVMISDRDSIRSGGYVHRHSLLTKAEVLTRLGKFVEAQRHFEEAIALAARCGDEILEDNAGHLADESACLSLETSSYRNGPISPARDETPDSSVFYERALTARLAATGNHGAAWRHRTRALRLCRAVSNVPGETEVHRSWIELTQRYSVNSRSRFIDLRRFGSRHRLAPPPRRPP